MDQACDTFVLIVGGGPVGLALALDLGRSGVPVILATANEETSQSPKCNYINTDTMEYFGRLEVADDIYRQNGDRKPIGHISFRTSFCGHELGNVRGSFPMSEGWPSSHYPQRFSQIFLESFLRRKVEKQSSVDVLFGWHVEDLLGNDEGAEAKIVHRQSGEKRSVRARFVVGCDGSGSRLRQFVGAALVGKDGAVDRKFLSKTKIAYFIQIHNLAERCTAPPAQLTWVINRTGRALVQRHDDADRFIIQYQAPDDRLPSDNDLVLRQMLGPEVEYSLLKTDYWEGGVAKVASVYRKGAAFLAGDAAHILMPLGGFSMATGLGDAQNLAWKLAATWQGWAGEQLLDSYAEERQEMAIRNSLIGIESADRKDRWVVPEDIDDDTPVAARRRQEFGRFLESDDRDEYNIIGAQLGARYASSVIVDAPDVAAVDRWDEYVPTDVAGARLPHAWLPDGRSLHSLLGPEFTLLLLGGDDCTGLEKSARKRAMPLKVLRLDLQNPSFKRTMVLVRPDFHIAWSADEAPDDPLFIIDCVRGSAG